MIMKKLYILITALLGVLGSQAQTSDDYVPLVREGVRWVYLYSDVTASSNEDDIIFKGQGDYAYFMEFRGDTVINDITYKKLYLSMSRNFDEWHLTPIAYMREENKRVLGFDANNIADGENVYYDFGDMAAFAQEIYEMNPYWYESPFTVTPFTVTVAGQPRNAYKIDNGWEWDYSLVIEGIGNDVNNMLSFGPLSGIPTCICPIPLGLAQVEDLEGNILYRGRYSYGPYTGKGSIALVNKIINVILGHEVFSHHYDFPCTNDCDVNADYVVDINDVNEIIARILNGN